MNLNDFATAGVSYSDIIDQSCSLYCNYIPVYALYRESKTEFFLKNNKLVLLYNKFSPRQDFELKTGRYDTFYSYWNRWLSPHLWKNSKNTVVVCKYCLMDTNYKLLACIALDSNVDPRTIDKENPDLSKFIFLIRKDFSTKHKHLWNRFSKDIVDNSELDLLFTDDIEKYCFNMQGFIPKFKAISEMQDYCKNVNNLLCLKEKQQPVKEEV